MAGDNRVDSGQEIFPLRNFKASSYRKMLGIVSKDTFIFNDSVKNTIAFGSLNTRPDYIVIEAAREFRSS